MIIMNKCPKCQREMEKGILSKKPGYPGRIEWGTEKSIGGVKNPKEVISYRCKNCGYLESYAK